MNKTYESGSVIVNWATYDLSDGWAEDTFLTFERSGADFDLEMGSDGIGTPVKLSDKSATITLTLKQTSVKNDILSNLSAQQNVKGAPVIVSDFIVIDELGGSDNFVALNAIMTEVPSAGFSTGTTDRVWVWKCESYLVAADPALITANLSAYISV